MNSFTNNENLTGFDFDTDLWTDTESVTSLSSSRSRSSVNGTVKRPPNAFIIYRRYKNAQMKREQPGVRAATLCSQVAFDWKNEPDHVKKPFIDMSRRLAAQHKRDHPNFIWVTGKKENNSTKLNRVEALKRETPRPRSNSIASISSELDVKQGSSRPFQMYESFDQMGHWLKNQNLLDSPQLGENFLDYLNSPMTSSPYLGSPTLSCTSLADQDTLKSFDLAGGMPLVKNSPMIQQQYLGSPMSQHQYLGSPMPQRMSPFMENLSQGVASKDKQNSISEGMSPYLTAGELSCNSPAWSLFAAETSSLPDLHYDPLMDKSLLGSLDRLFDTDSLFDPKESLFDTNSLFDPKDPLLLQGPLFDFDTDDSLGMPPLHWNRLLSDSSLPKLSDDPSIQKYFDQCAILQ